jgi:hypothetical protein
MYAIGGSANPTINSQGNRFLAPVKGSSKEVSVASSILLNPLLSTLSEVLDGVDQYK